MNKLNAAKAKLNKIAKDDRVYITTVIVGCVAAAIVAQKIAEKIIPVNEETE